MAETGIESLTSQEKVVLRQVAPGVRVKTIGSNLGISTETVRVHLRHAREKLRVSTSLDAAHLLAANEALIAENRVTPLKVMARSSGQTDSSEATWGPPLPPALDVVREASASTLPVTNFRPKHAPTGGNRNALSPLLRLTIIVAMTVGLVLAIVAAPALYDSMQRVGNFIEPPR